MDNAIFQKICLLLSSHDIQFRTIEHPPTFTSEESAAARKEPLEIGAKALLIRIGDEFKLMVIPADCRLDSAAVKSYFSVKKSRFASPEELLKQTGLVPGSVPPFGSPILPFPIFADILVGQRSEKIAFNAGSLTHSIIMRADDWKKVASPEIIRCAL